MGVGRSIFMFITAASTYSTASAAQIPGTRVPGGCDVPASQRTSPTGCYFVASEQLDTLPNAPIFWHIYAFPSRREALRADSAARATRSPIRVVTSVVRSLDRDWLLALGPASWRLRGSEALAVVGPIIPTPAPRYVVRYMEATFDPGMQTAVHVHSGPEAWYLVDGAQCLQTPDTTIVARRGEGAVVAAGPPMRLSGIGSERRRSLVLVLHDASQPWMAMSTGWAPSAPC